MAPTIDPSLLDWLSSSENPAVRYMVARDLLDEPPPRAELALLRKSVRHWEPLQRILELQLDDGSFPNDQKTKTAQPSLAAVQLMQVCGMDTEDEPVQRLLRYLTMEASHGVVSYTGGASGVLPCYVGVTTTALIKMGAIDSDLVQASIQWLADHQRFDQKERRSGGSEVWKYRAPQNFGCWDSVSCYHGVAGAFRAFAALPPDRRSPEVQERLEDATEYLRARQLYKKRSTGAPLFRHLTQFFLVGDYRYDLLDMLSGVADYDPQLIREDWISDAVAVVHDLSNGGRVTLHKNYGRKLSDPIPVEPVGRPSRFLTYQWLMTKQVFDAARNN